MSLASFMQRQPQKLFNAIYDLTLTPASRDYVIDRSYEPPKGLQIDRASRDHFVRSFYGNDSIFHVDTQKTCVKWIKSLPLSHVEMIKSVRIVGETMAANNYLDLMHIMAIPRVTLARRIGKQFRWIGELFKFHVNYKACDYWLSCDDVLQSDLSP